MLPKQLALVVEDDPGLCDLLCQMLRMIQYDAHGVTSPAAALAWLDGHTPDVVLMDLGLPGDPYALHRALSAGNLPVVVLSAHSPDDTPVSLDQLSVLRLWLRKPLRMGQLKAALASL